MKGKLNLGFAISVLASRRNECPFPSPSCSAGVPRKSPCSDHSKSSCLSGKGLVQPRGLLHHCEINEHGYCCHSSNMLSMCGHASTLHDRHNRIDSPIRDISVESIHVGFILRPLPPSQRVGAWYSCTMLPLMRRYDRCDDGVLWLWLWFPQNARRWNKDGSHSAGFTLASSQNSS